MIIASRNIQGEMKYHDVVNLIQNAAANSLHKNPFVFCGKECKFSKSIMSLEDWILLNSFNL